MLETHQLYISLSFSTPFSIHLSKKSISLIPLLPTHLCLHILYFFPLLHPSLSLSLSPSPSLSLSPGQCLSMYLAVFWSHSALTLIFFLCIYLFISVHLFFFHCHFAVCLCFSHSDLPLSICPFACLSLSPLTLITWWFRFPSYIIFFSLPFLYLSSPAAATTFCASVNVPACLYLFTFHFLCLYTNICLCLSLFSSFSYFSPSLTISSCSISLIGLNGSSYLE